MAHIYLPKTTQKAIIDAVDRVYERLKAKALGMKGKTLSFPDILSLAGLYATASKQEGVEPRENAAKSLISIAETYLDAHKEKTKAKILQEIQSTLTDIQNQGIKTDLETVVGGKLTEVWAEAKKDVTRVLETETTRVRNGSIFDSVSRIGGLMNIDDPTVFFVVVRDNSRCGECTRLHLLEDGVTPRVWKMSELGAGYHTKGDGNPKIGGLHPHCLTGSQRIHTDRGLLTAQELFVAGGVLSVTVDNRIRARRVGNNQFGAEIPGQSWLYRHSNGSHRRQATHVYDTGLQECYRIELDSGHVLEVSAGHEMWVDDNRSGCKIPAYKLKTGDKIPLLSGSGDFGQDNFPELAELMGNLIGDGSIIENTAFWKFFGDDIEYGQKLRALASDFSSSLSEKLEQMTVFPPDDKYRVPRASFNSTVLGRVFREDFGLSKKPRRVPSRVWGANKITVSAFLRGLFAADGHVDNLSVALSQNNLDFLREIQQLLSNFGLVSRIYKHGESCVKSIRYADGRVFETQRKEAWRLHIGGRSQIEKFADCIGFGVRAKQQRLCDVLDKSEEAFELRHWRTSRVASIIPIGVQQTYCLTEPVTNTITVNGVVTGQCRCVLTHLLPGYGFDASGRITYKTPDHDELAVQRK